MTERETAASPLEIASGRSVHAAVMGKGPEKGKGPAFLYEPGAFGIYADGWWICQALAARGGRAVTYTRAGHFMSDDLPDGALPSPAFHADDMARVLDATGIAERVVLIAHSMGGLRAHAFAQRYRDRLAGIVLLDAVSPAQLAWRPRRDIARWGARSISVCEASAANGLAAQVMRLYPNSMQLDDRRRADKIASYADARHLAATRREILATTDPAVAGDLAGLPGLPVTGIVSSAVGRGTAAVLDHVRRQGGAVDLIEAPRLGHVKILSPSFAEKVADCAWSLHAKADLSRATAATAA